MRCLRSIARRYRRWMWQRSNGGRLASTAIVHGIERLTVGPRVAIGDHVVIWAAGGVSIGAESLVAAGTVITSQSHAVDALRMGRTYRETAVTEPIRIGANVWIGANATVLPGARIGDNSIIAAGSVVKGKIPPATLVAGVPARVVRSLDFLEQTSPALEDTE